MAISGNKLICAGGKAAPAYGDPGIWYDEVVTRAAGVMLLGDFNITDVTKILLFGFDSDQSGTTASSGIKVQSVIRASESSTAIVSSLYTLVNATEYRFGLLLAAAGAHYFVRDAGAWHYLGDWGTSNTASLYAGIANYNAAWSADNIVVPSSVNWLPAPMLSDGFATTFGTSDGLGHAEGVADSVGKGGSGVAWVEEGAWGISSGEATNTPPGGGELLTDGDMEDDPATNWTAGGSAVLTNTAEERDGGAGAQSLDVAKASAGDPAATQNGFVETNGEIKLLTGWIKNVDASYGQLRLYDVGIGGYIDSIQRSATSWGFDAVSQPIISTTTITGYLKTKTAGAQSALFDDASLQVLSVADCIATYDANLSDVLLSAELTLPYDTHAGLILNLDDATTPANYTLVTQSGPTGDDIEVWKCVAGVLSRVSTTAGTYSAGKALRVRKSGNEVWVYYNDTYITKATIADAGIVDNTIHGIFSTYVSNTIDNATIYGEGATGEWTTLNRFDS